MGESLESKAIQLNQASDIKLRSQLDEIESLKKSICGYEESANQHINEKKKLTEELLIKIEEIKMKSEADLLPLKELKVKHSELMAEHEKFSKEHAAAIERSKLYDKDM